LDYILEAKEQGKHFWWRWADRFANNFCIRKFGKDWMGKDPEFWKTFDNTVS